MSEQEQARAAQFALQRIYIKDVSFESPNAPDAFLKEWKPRVNLELNARHAHVSDDNYEVVLAVTVTATDEEEKVIYLVEVQQAGIFRVTGMTDEARAQALGSFCPNLLYPYAREVVDSIVVKGSFPALMLAPVNFEAVYAQAKKAQAEQKDAALQ